MENFIGIVLFFPAVDDVFRIEKRASEKEAFPTPCSIRDALTKYYDISVRTTFVY